MRVALISDTHGTLRPAVQRHLEAADAVWHAGDVGPVDFVQRLAGLRPLTAVFGNADGQSSRLYIRSNCQSSRVAEAVPPPPGGLLFEAEGLRVAMIHEGGRQPIPPYAVEQWLRRAKPDVFVSGHTHILRVVRHPVSRLLMLNPGACGQYAVSPMPTLLLFDVERGRLSNLRAVELPNG